MFRHEVNQQIKHVQQVFILYIHTQHQLHISSFSFNSTQHEIFIMFQNKHYFVLFFKKWLLAEAVFCFLHTGQCQLNSAAIFKNATLLLFTKCQHNDADDFSNEPDYNTVYQFNILNQNIFLGGGMHSNACLLVYIFFSDSPADQTNLQISMHNGSQSTEYASFSFKLHQKT